MADAGKVVGIAAVVTLTVGATNSILKDKKPPSGRFLIGTGVAFCILAAMAEFDGSDEIAKGIALGVMTTVVLSGEAGGLLSYIDTGELKTTKPAEDKVKTTATGRQTRQVVRTVQVQRPGAFQVPQNPAAAIPGLTGNRPATPGF